MLRMYIVQQCFGLSDEGMEDVIYDSQAIRRFIGIDLTVETASDAITLLKFRRLLETHSLNADRPQSRLRQIPGFIRFLS
jgi:transposase, IS5 family